MPTKIAWLSFPARNHMLTLRRKLRKAAVMKKYLLFILGFLLFEIRNQILSRRFDLVNSAHEFSADVDPLEERQFIFHAGIWLI